MCAKFGCGPMVVLKKGGDRQTKGNCSFIYSRYYQQSHVLRLVKQVAHISWFCKKCEQLIREIVLRLNVHPKTNNTLPLEGQA